MNTLALVAEEAGEGRLPPLGWGIGAFAILMLMLTIVLMFGKGRPHA